MAAHPKRARRNHADVPGFLMMIVLLVLVGGSILFLIDWVKSLFAT